jgi:hypothetical protein
MSFTKAIRRLVEKVLGRSPNRSTAAAAHESPA